MKGFTLIEKLIVLAIFAIIATTVWQAANASNIKNGLIDSGIRFMYVLNKDDGSEYVTLFDKEDLPIACAIDGIDTVTIKGTEHSCKSVK